MESSLHLLAFFAGIAAPGYLLLSRDLDAATAATERWALYLGVGFWGVALAASVCLVVPVGYVGLHGARIVPFCALALTLGAGVRWRRRPARAFRPVTAIERVTLVLALGVFLLSFVGIDDRLYTQGCLYRNIDALVSPTSPGGPLLAQLDGDERLGNVVASWLPHSLLPWVSSRLGSGLFATLLFLATVALGRRITGRTWPGLAAAVAVILTADVFGHPVLDQNVIGAWTATLLLLLLHPDHGALPRSRVLLGAMLVSSRLVALVGMGALVLGLARDDARDGARDDARPDARLAREVPERRRRRLLGCAALFAVFLLPTVIALASGAVRVDRIFGNRLLNFPLHTELVRTPLMPFPMWIGWPVHALGQWGLLGVALAVLGWGLLWRRRVERPEARSFALYAIPLALALGVQENWMEPEKMSMGLLFAPVLTGGMAVALHWLAGPGWPRRWAVLGATTLALAAAALAAGAVLRSVSFTADERVWRISPGLPSETPALLAFERERWLSPRLLPSPSEPCSGRSLRRRLDATVAALAEGSAHRRARSISQTAIAYIEDAAFNVADAERAIAPPGPAVEPTRRWLLDLAASPVVAAAPLAPMAAASPPARLVLDLSDGRGCVMSAVEGMRVAFSDRPMRVLACRASGDEVFVWLSPPLIPPFYPPPAAAPPSWTWARPPSLADWPITGRAELRLPASTRHVTLLEFLSVVPTRVYARLVDLHPERPPEHGAPFIWYNN